MARKKEHNETPRKRGDKWQARYTAPDGSRPSAGMFDRKRDAQVAINAAYGNPTQAPTTVGGYAPRWLAEHPVSERTTRTNRGRLNAVLDVELEGVPLRDWEMLDLGRLQAKELIGKLFTEQQRAPGGVRNHLRVLSAMFTAAIGDDADLCKTNPWGVTVRDDDKRAVKAGREPRIWSWEEMHEFAAFAGPWEPMIRTMSDCGLRPGELFALRRSGLLIAERVLQIRDSAWEGIVVPSTPQKNHDRDVPITDELLALLASLPTMLHSEWLFPTPGWRVRPSATTGRFEPVSSAAGYGKGSGKLWRYSNWIRRVWQPTVGRANAEPRERRLDPIPGDFRHSWVSHVRDAGVNPAAVAAVAGHTVETESRVYTKRVQDRFEEIRRAVG